MRRLTHSLAVLAAILLAGCLAAGCSSGAKSAIANLSPSRSAASPGPTAGSPASPTATRAAHHKRAAHHSAPPTTAPPTLAPRGAQCRHVCSCASAEQLTGSWHVEFQSPVALAFARRLGRHRRDRLDRPGSRPRQGRGPSWQSGVIDAYAKGSALHDAMSVADTPGALAAADAGARWSDIQRRADDLAQNLYALREAAPDDDARARVADTLAALQAVRSAMDAERAPGGAAAGQGEVARQRLMSLETALRALRASDQQGR